MMNQSLAFAVITIFFCVWVCSAMPKGDLDELENSAGDSSGREKRSYCTCSDNGGLGILRPFVCHGDERSCPSPAATPPFTVCCETV